MLVSAVALCLGVVAVALGSFSPTITLSAGGQDAASPAVAVGAGGDGVAVWTRFDGNNSRVQARTVSPGGGLGPIQTLSAAGSSAFSPQVAVDADGDAVVVWTRLDGSAIAQARRISAAGVLGPVLDLSPHGEDASGPQVAIDAGGNAIALWYRSNVGALQVLGRALPVTGSPGPLLRLSSAAANGSQPRVGVTPGGGGYAVWVGTDGANSRAQGRSIDTAGNRGPVRFLSPAGSNAGFPRVDVDDSANAYAIWTRTIGANTRVEGRSVSAAGTLGPVTTLSAGGQNAILPAISLAGDQWSSGLGPLRWREPEDPGRRGVADRRDRHARHDLGGRPRRDEPRGRVRQHRERPGGLAALGRHQRPDPGAAVLALRLPAADREPLPRRR